MSDDEATKTADWTPDGPNCRQCGRHDYALWLCRLPLSARDAWFPACKTAGCPLNRTAEAKP